jgi:hypothetical protein
MEIQILENDVRLLCHQARSFPAGVLGAFKFIEQANPDFCRRTFYGLSRGNRNGGIDYWAAVEQLENKESELGGLEPKVLRRGRYASVTVKEFRRNLTAIAGAFEMLLTNPDMDPATYCVELYHNDTVTCMVRLKGEEVHKNQYLNSLKSKTIDK